MAYFDQKLQDGLLDFDNNTDHDHSVMQGYGPAPIDGFPRLYYMPPVYCRCLGVLTLTAVTALGFAIAALILALCMQQGIPGPPGEQGPIGGGGPIGPAGTAGLPTGVTTTTVTECEYGGVNITFCVDHDQDGLCDSPGDVITGSTVVCNGGDGPAGPAGSPAGFSFDPVPFNSTACEFGGVNITVCVDADMDGLCESPGDAFLMWKVICNGGAGPQGVPGPSGLSTAVTSEPSVDCDYGGVNVTACVDGDGDGACTSVEDVITGTWLLCDGAPGPVGATGGIGPQGIPGKNAGFSLISVPVNSSTCPTGGVEVAVCVDGNADGLCDDISDVLIGTTIICNGAVGPQGPQGNAGPMGNPAGFSFDPVPFNSTTCEFGGVNITVCVDGDLDGMCDSPGDTFLMWKVICNGAAGAQGIQGPPGPEGAATGLSLTPTTVNGTECLNVTVCVDGDADGACDSVPTDTNVRWNVLCNGGEGPQGPVGPMGNPAGFSFDAVPFNSTTCEFGGVNITVCVDGDLDGLCDSPSDAFLMSKVICNGQSGPQGTQGVQGDAGDSAGFTLDPVIINGTVCTNVTVCVDGDADGECATPGVDTQLRWFVLCDGSVGPQGPQGNQGPAGNPAGFSFDPVPFNSTTCEFGGVNITVCVDGDLDGACDSPGDTFLMWKIICNGGAGEKGDIGPQGEPGNSAGFSFAMVPTNSSACPTGGVNVTTCVDGDADGACDSAQDTQLTWRVICNGEQGLQGPQGVKGDTGTPAGFSFTSIPANSSACEFGGVNVTVCTDNDADGLCDSMVDEFLAFRELCNANIGVPGPPGPPGPQGNSSLVGLEGNCGDTLVWDSGMNKYVPTRPLQSISFSVTPTTTTFFITGTYIVAFPGLMGDYVPVMAQFWRVSRVLLVVNSLTGSGNATITGARINDVTGVYETGITENMFIDAGGGQRYQSLNQWATVTSIVFDPSITSIGYDAGYLRHWGRSDRDFIITGLRVEVRGQNQNTKVRYRIRKVQMTDPIANPSKFSIVTLEDIKLDSSAGAGQVTDNVRSGPANRGYSVVGPLYNTGEPHTSKYVDYVDYWGMTAAISGSTREGVIIDLFEISQNREISIFLYTLPIASAANCSFA